MRTRRLAPLEMKMSNESGLELSIADQDDVKYGTCDGCGRKWVAGDKMIINIESCCGGGCSRSICEQCVRHSLALIEKGE